VAARRHQRYLKLRLAGMMHGDPAESIAHGDVGVRFEAAHRARCTVGGSPTSWVNLDENEPRLTTMLRIVGAGEMMRYQPQHPAAHCL
jgi:hypothetical protein